MQMTLRSAVIRAFGWVSARGRPGFSCKIGIADKWWVLIAVTLGMFLSIMDATIVIVAVPELQAVFKADVHAIQWVATIYMLTQAIVIPTAPYLAKRLGAERAYVWTLIAFLIGSALCGFAWNLSTLVLFRFIQGIGGRGIPRCSRG